MTTGLLMFFRQRSDSGFFELLYGCVILAFVAAWAAWDRSYRDKWHEFRSRNWTRVKGRFDEGELVTMRKGRSQTVSGYEVWLSYEYQVDGDQIGVFRLSERTEHEAEAAMKMMANREVTVRVNPRNPKKSFVVEEDL
jgi:hypothetical protein